MVESRVPSIDFTWLGNLPATMEQGRMRAGRRSLADLDFNNPAALQSAVSELIRSGNFEEAKRIDDIYKSRREQALQERTQRIVEEDIRRQQGLDPGGTVGTGGAGPVGTGAPAPVTGLPNYPGIMFPQTRAAIAAQADRYDPEKLSRQIYAESKGRPGLTSSAGARGTTQFMPATARQYNVRIGDVQDEVRAGVDKMLDLEKKYGNWGLALAAYNWGDKGMDLWLSGRGRPPPRETINYVKNISGRPIEDWLREGPSAGSPRAPLTATPARPAGPPPVAAPVTPGVLPQAPLVAAPPAAGPALIPAAGPGAVPAMPPQAVPQMPPVPAMPGPGAGPAMPGALPGGAPLPGMLPGQGLPPATPGLVPPEAAPVRGLPPVGPGPALEQQVPNILPGGQGAVPAPTRYASLGQPGVMSDAGPELPVPGAQVAQVYPSGGRTPGVLSPQMDEEVPRAPQALPRQLPPGERPAAPPGSFNRADNRRLLELQNILRLQGLSKGAHDAYLEQFKSGLARSALTDDEKNYRLYFDQEVAAGRRPELYDAWKTRHGPLKETHRDKIEADLLKEGYIKTQEKVAKANDILTILSPMKRIAADEGFMSGQFAGKATQLGSAAIYVHGLLQKMAPDMPLPNISDLKRGIGLTNVFEAMGNRLVLATTGSLGNQISEGDRNFVQNMFPNLTLTKEGNMLLIRYSEAIANHNKAAAAEERRFRSANRGLTQMDIDSHMETWGERNKVFTPEQMAEAERVSNIPPNLDEWHRGGSAGGGRATPADRGNKTLGIPNEGLKLLRQNIEGADEATRKKHIEMFRKDFNLQPGTVEKMLESNRGR